ncbi:adhesin [Klebsiella sp. A-Nf5]|uniref:fimbrial protein n=1 Tax=Klebsiella sp. A-Nf5 TaxID=2054608 RepID=UPI000C295BC2|nr:fimbrial protein [Klebsiella sp. A-Nf5]PJX32794.1 adhesin [Klebsiella sp. A-Nf5]
MKFSVSILSVNRVMTSQSGGMLSAASLMFLMMFSGAVRADDRLKGEPLAKVNIELSGTITAMSCKVDPTDRDKTVQLGSWDTKQLHYTGHSVPVYFNIHLTNCTASGVTLSFTGKKDKTDPTLLALSDNSTGAGVAVEIMDAAHNRIAMGEHYSRVAVDKKGDAVLAFSARYAAVSPVSAGTAYAESEFTLTYD